MLIGVISITRPFSIFLATLLSGISHIDSAAAPAFHDSFRPHSFDIIYAVTQSASADSARFCAPPYSALLEYRRAHLLRAAVISSASS